MAGPAPSTGGAVKRSADLDLLKTILVWGMIAAHCIQLLAFRPKPAALFVSDFINLVTFSGFLFAFGIGIGLSKSGGNRSWIQRLQPALMLLAATYVSELAFVTLVDRKALSSDLLVSLFSMTRLYGWSEFLASFFVLYLLLAIVRSPLVWVASRWWTMAAAILICFATTWIVINSSVPLLATIVGTNSFASFPLLAYLPWFLIGIYFGRHRPEPGVVAWAVATIASAAFVFMLWRINELPGRFPPTILWVVGPALPLLVYYFSARWLAAKARIPSALLASGRHVLASLLASNLIIFSLRHWLGYSIGAWWWTAVIWLALLVIVTAWGLVLDRVRARRGQPAVS